MSSPDPLSRIPVVALLALSGCSFVSGKEWRDIVDADHDDVIAERFGGSDCDDADPDLGACDLDGDGQRSAEDGGEDCDDHDAGVVFEPELFTDEDGDGYGDESAPTDGCVGFGAAKLGGDCDDDEAEVHPQAPEHCGDEVDQDCSGDPHDSVDEGTRWFVDRDGDGFAGPEVAEVARCEPARDEDTVATDCNDDDPDAWPGAEDEPYDNVDADCAGDSDDDADHDGHDRFQAGGDDCDDDDEDVFPGADEVCNQGIDDDCDGLADDLDPGVRPGGRLPWSPDLDQDGFGGPALDWCDGAEPAGWIRDASDCDDRRADVNPSADEVCNGVDDDCDGDEDENPVGGPPTFQDDDGDGWGGVRVVPVCDPDDPSDDVVGQGGDCDDLDATTFPGADDACDDGIRHDCNRPPDDCDADGWADALDCAPADPAVNPGRREVCDGLDNDCDGLYDDADDSVDETTRADWYADLDHDGYGSDVLVSLQGCSPPASSARNPLDCEDLDDTVHPLADERCNLLDDDCDDEIDEDPVDAPTWYPDPDRDRFGDDRSGFPGDCGPVPPGYAVTGGDCAATNPAVHPEAIEVCNAGRDDDCDGLADDADPGVDGAEFWIDGDGDGWGDPAQVVRSCTPGSGRVGVGLDCNDQDPTANPGSTERCNGSDDDCDALVDLDDPDLVDPGTWWPDLDADGFGDPDGPTSAACEPPPATAPNDLDCDDGDPLRDPGNLEACDGFDNDCDELVDESPAVGSRVWYLDLDEDGAYGTPIVACAQPPLTDAVATDCDDQDDAAEPGNPEICDGSDNDCDGEVDDVPSSFLPDEDGDGYGSAEADNVLFVGCALAGHVLEEAPFDCDDTPPDGAAQSPGIPFDFCGDFLDNDCDLDIDEGCDLGESGAPDSADSGSSGDTGTDTDGFGRDLEPPTPPGRLWWRDADTDGFGDAADLDPEFLPTDPSTVGDTYAPNPLDCDDNDRSKIPTPVFGAAGLQNTLDTLITSDCVSYELVGLDYDGVTALSLPFDAHVHVGGRGDTIRPRLRDLSVFLGGGVDPVFALSGVDLGRQFESDAVFDVTFGEVRLADLTSYGQDLAVVSGGALRTTLVTVADAPSATVLAAGGTWTADRFAVYDSEYTEIGPGTLSRLTFVRSGPARIEGAATVRELRATACDTDCVDVAGNAAPDLDRLELLGGTGAGLRYGAGAPLVVRHVTALGNNPNLDALSPLEAHDSNLYYGTSIGGMALCSTNCNAAFGLPVTPQILFWAAGPALPPESWDVHLRYAHGDYTFQRGRHDQLALDALGNVDGDPLPDWWELHWFGDTALRDGSGDYDGDGSLDVDELGEWSSPIAFDTDADGTPDGADPAPIDENSP